MEDLRYHNMFKDSKKKYEIVPNAVSYELSNFLFNYLLMTRDASAFLIQQEMIKDQLGTPFGTWRDPQIPNTFSKYGDAGLETLLMKLLPMTSKITQQNLIPCYAYGRIYKKGDILHRHIDRPSCEVSCTINLGGEPWPIFMGISKKKSIKKKKKKPSKGISVLLKPGDMLIYCGHHIEHWREPFQGNNHCQAFMHYNNKDGPYGQENMFDRRPMLGLPNVTQNRQR